MPTVAAGNTVGVIVPAGATLTMSGQGLHQTAPPGANGQALKQITMINAQPQVFGPFSSTVTVNVSADLGYAPGVTYSIQLPGTAPVPVMVLPSRVTTGAILYVILSQNWTATGYQWTRNGTNISGATSSTYTTVSADTGTTVTCIVAGVPYAPVGSAVSAVPVTSGPSLPVITSAAVITAAVAGTAIVYTNAASTSTPTPTISYFLLKNGTTVASGAAAISAYTSYVASDSLVVRAIPTNANGTGSALDSAAYIATSGAVSSLRQVATRSFVPNLLGTSLNYSDSRTAHVATDALTSIQVSYPAWYCTSNQNEAGSGTTIQYTAGLEYPAGTFTQVKWSGSATVTATSGNDTGLSDAIACSIPKGATFWLRNHAVTNSGVGTGGGLCLNSNTTSNKWLSAGEAATSSATLTTDKSVSGTIADDGTSSIIYPLCIVANSSSAAFLFIGDSRTVGITSSAVSPDANGQLGQIAQSFGSTYASINAGISGATINAFNVGGTRRAALGQYATHVINGFGANDLRQASGNKSTAFFQGDYFIAAKRFPTQTLIACTVSPSDPSSTDGYATVVNQTADANSAAFTASNAYLMGVPTPYKAVLDIAGTTADATTTTAWKAGYTSDGLHANATGYAAIVSSGIINPATLAALAPVAQYSVLSIGNAKKVMWMDVSNVSITPTSGASLNGAASGYTWTGSTAPTYGATSFNGGPGQTYNGTTNGFIGGAATKSILNAATGATLASLFQLVSNPGATNVVVGVSISGANTPRAFLCVNSSGVPALQYRRQDADAVTTLTSTLGALTTGVPSLVVGTFDPVNNVVTLSVNGVLAASGTFVTSGAVAFSATDSNNLVIGNVSGAGVAVTSREYIITDKYLGTSDRQKLEGDIAWRQGVNTLVLPVGHPYYSAAPTSN